MTPSTPHLGARLGPRLADLMARGVTEHLRQSSDLRARIHQAGLDRFWRQVGREYKTVFGGQLRRYAEHDEMPDELRPLFEFLARQPGEGAAMLSTLYFGTGLGQTFGAVVSNLLAPLVHGDLHAAPNALLPPDLLAQLVAKGIYDHQDAASDAGGSAVAGWRFDQMVENAIAFPDPAMALDLERRGALEGGRLYLILKRAGYSDTSINEITQLFWNPLQPADLAEMTVRGVIDPGTGREIARKSGVPPEDFDRLALIAGEPPGPEQLMEAYRRGFIDQGRFEHGIRQSRIRNEWMDVETRLREEPMDTSQAVDAVVQGHLTDAQGRKVSEVNGLEGQYWPVLVQTAGEPIAKEEALQLFRRGKMTRAEVEQAIRESRIKNKYIGKVLDLELHLPPERSIVMMLSHGAIAEPEALRLLHELGFDPTVAKAMVKAGTAQRRTSTRHLAVGTITELYQDGAIDHAEAHKTLTGLGYTPHDADLELKVADLRAEHAFRRQAASRVGAAYVGRVIDHAAAVNLLDRVGLPGPQRDRLLELWDLERAAHVRRPSEAQIHSAVKKGLLTPGDGVSRLQSMGYDQADAQLLLEL